MGFTKPIVTPISDWYQSHYYPKLKLLDDTLYVCSNTGIYRKNLKSNSNWELFAFKNTPIIDFVINENRILAISTGTRDGKDSLLLLSNDFGQSFTNYTSPHFLEYGENYLQQISQNPVNKNYILVGQVNYGISISYDFGVTWVRLNGGEQAYFEHLGYHPLDTTMLFTAGENDGLQSLLCKSVDNGNTWDCGLQLIDDRILCIAFHPINPDILMWTSRWEIGKSIDKGNTWWHSMLSAKVCYYRKVLFDENNPTHIYIVGMGEYGWIEMTELYVFRSTDTGETWEVLYVEDIPTCGWVIDMLKYKNKLIFYTYNCGLFELSVADVGIKNIDNVEEVIIYPNPTTNDLIIEGKDLNKIEILDITGKLVFSNHLISISSNQNIDISNLKSGIYFIKVITTQGEIVKKVVKL
jgi:hypothetical protein